MQLLRADCGEQIVQPAAGKIEFFDGFVFDPPGEVVVGDGHGTFGKHSRSRDRLARVEKMFHTSVSRIGVNESLAVKISQVSDATPAGDGFCIDEGHRRVITNDDVRDAVVAVNNIGAGNLIAVSPGRDLVAMIDQRRAGWGEVGNPGLPLVVAAQHGFQLSGVIGRCREPQRGLAFVCGQNCRHSWRIKSSSGHPIGHVFLKRVCAAMCQVPGSHPPRNGPAVISCEVDGWICLTNASGICFCWVRFQHRLLIIRCDQPSTVLRAAGKTTLRTPSSPQLLIDFREQEFDLLRVTVAGTYRVACNIVFATVVRNCHRPSVRDFYAIRDGLTYTGAFGARSRPTGCLACGPVKLMRSNSGGPALEWPREGTGWPSGVMAMVRSDAYPEKPAADRLQFLDPDHDCKQSAAVAISHRINLLVIQIDCFQVAWWFQKLRDRGRTLCFCEWCIRRSNLIHPGCWL